MDENTVQRLETLRNFKKIIERKIDCLERGVPDDEGGYTFNQEERDVVAAWHKEHPGEDPRPFVYTLPGVVAWEERRRADRVPMPPTASSAPFNRP